MKKRILIPALALLIVFALAVPSFAWFARASVIISGDDPHKLSASSKSAYFASGDGTADNPYVLSNEVHLYNLAWLQYIGYFNKGEVNNSLDQTYFVLEDNIDANGLTLPPIGTTEYPFIGNFDGNNYCISNINTANVSTAFDLKPSNAEFKVNSLLTKFSDKAATEVGNVMGFFGVIGSYSGEATGSNVDTSVIAVKNFGLTDYTLTSSSETTTVGFVAGYVSATLENVLVCNCTINTPSANGGVANADYASEYTLVGYSTAPESLKENNVTVYDPTITTEIIGSGSGGVGEGGVGSFGGSMDMVELVRRLSYMYAENENNGKQFPINNYSTARSDSGAVYHLNAGTVYLGSDSIIPLNIDKDKMFYSSITRDENGNIISSTEHEESKYTSSKSNNYYTNSWYKENNAEIISKNTGYIVGGGNSTSAGTQWIRVRNLAINSSTYKGIYKSLTTLGAGNASSINRTNLELLTINGEGEICKIVDYITDVDGNNTLVSKSGSVIGSSNYKSINSYDLARYSTVMNNYIETMSGKTMLTGLRFDASSERGIELSNNNVISSTTTIDAYIYDDQNPKSNYELINGAINFSLQSAGYITAIAGTYFYTTETNHSLFTLMKITRDEDTNEITNVLEIKSVWVLKSNGQVVDIQYNLSNGNYNGKTYTCAYSENKLTVAHAAYYFEIPVLAGDYAIGALKNDSAGAYLMYLDIGTNGSIMDLGGSTNPTKVISEYIEESENEYKYVSGVTVAEIGADGAIVDNAPLGNIAIQIAGDNRQSVTVSRNGDEISVSGGTLTMLGAGLTSAENALPTPTVGTTTVTRRRTYVHSDGAKITVTRTNEDDSTITVTAKDGDGQDIAITENTTTGGVTTVKTAKRTYTITWADIKPTTAVIAYTYTAASDATVTNSPVFTAADSGNTGSYKVTVSATETATVTVTTNTDGTVAKGNTVDAGSNVTISP